MTRTLRTLRTLTVTVTMRTLTTMMTRRRVVVGDTNGCGWTEYSLHT